MTKILIIEDDINLGTTLSSALETVGYAVNYLSDGNQALASFRSFQPDLLITDVMLNSTLDGFELARIIRAESNIPVLFTTSKDSTEDIKAGLGLGNSDFIRKPYRFIEVTMRVENILSLQNKPTNHTLTYLHIGNYLFYPNTCKLEFEHIETELTKYESLVLQLLIEHCESFVSRKELVQKIWAEDDPKLKEASLNNILSKLRKYLSHDLRIEIESKMNAGIRLHIG